MLNALMAIHHMIERGEKQKALHRCEAAMGDLKTLREKEKSHGQ